MAEIPTTLENAIAQAKEATVAAIADGYTRLQVELVFPEIKPMPVAEQFLSGFAQFGNQLKVFFPDAGAAALARRDWGDVQFKIMDIGTGRLPVDEKIQPEDEAFLFISPSSVEVIQVEQLCNLAGNRPVVLLNPRLEDVATVGIGYAGRQLRGRFLNNIESCYYLRPLEGAAIFRCYPSSWQIWQEKGDEYKMIVELPKKPVGEEIEQILLSQTSPAESNLPAPKKPGMLANMQRFMRILSR